ncbi:putative short-chain dehydrogenase [Lophiostoma macrostomum CBS 122681]|uniref:Putative short-chain dehydrogenase n=1 Tax=Lophiostoma macrostomum CBS 122681 TaxID=1314788 RepID=A0A6A6T4R5_9PLEO|nr:putative short-chain dehydrogenase [Lophiostoma macrostomum CBS 122681]
MSNSLIPYAESFAQPQGPGDARPTALQVIRDNDLVNKWTGRVVLITGATSGIGIETARALHATGADVYITARNAEKAFGVITDIRNSSEGRGALVAIDMDMDSLDSVKKAAKDFLTESDGKLNILINNAGIMATPAGSKTQDGFESQFGVNHLAHYTLTALLLPTLIKSSTPSFNSRVVALTSNGHRYSPVRFDDVNLTHDYDPWLAYGQSKTACIWLANHIDRVYGAQGVHTNSVHPGGIATGLQVNLSQDVMAEWGKDPALMAVFQSAEQGAATTVWAAVAPVWEGKGGKYLTNCSVGEPAKDGFDIKDYGFAPHVYDEEGEEKLWALSEELTGVKVEI